MNLYSSSRGLKKSDVEEMTNEDAMKIVADSELVYRENYVIGEDCERAKHEVSDKRA